MKYALHLKQSGPFAGNVPIVELEDDCIALNNIVFAWETNPHGVRLWVIGNEYGALGAVWADCEQDALDELVDQNLGAGLAIEEKDADDETALLGNAGEPHDLTYAWIAEVDLTDTQKCFGLYMKLAEARGAGYDFLSKL
jgi:hypothetical protein